MSIVDRIVLDLGLVKSFLGIDHAEDDAVLAILIGWAKEQADLFLNNEFTTVDDEGYTVNLDIPFSVLLGCLKCIATGYEHRGSADVTSSNVSGVAFQYGEASEAAKRDWRPYRKNPGT